MRKMFLIGLATVAVGCVGAYCYFTRQVAPINVDTPVTANRPTRQANDDGAAEASDVIEPLVVERSGADNSNMPRPVIFNGPLDRATWTPATTQPPRPDADGRVLRMPYADEDEILGIPLDPIQRILDSTRPRLDIFEHLDPSEEAEPKEETPPAMNPHHHHPFCPHTGGCPAPYPYRMGPRN